MTAHPPLYQVLERVHFRSACARVYRVRMHGVDRIPATGPVILVANHECVFDQSILALATPRPIRYMAKAELWRYPVVRWAMEKFGTFPIERGAGDSAAMSRAAALLAQGEVLGMFPQGTSKQLPSRPLHRGAARLALVTGAPIVPVRMTGTRSLRGPVRIDVAEPIVVEPAKPTVSAAKEITRRVEREILA